MHRNWAPLCTGITHRYTGGVQRHKLFSKTNISVYVPTKRIKFISETGEHTKSPAHHSVIMMINAPKTEIIFEYQRGIGK